MEPEQTEGKVNSESTAEKKREDPTNKGKEVTKEATNKELVEVTSELQAVATLKKSDLHQLCNSINHLCT